MLRVCTAMFRCCFILGVVVFGSTTARAVVQVEVFEKIPADDPWSATELTTTYSKGAFAWVGLPKRYIRGGLIDDRSNPFLLRATAEIDLPAGQFEFLLRAKNVSRLLIDGEVIIEQQSKLSRNADGHEETPELPPPIRPGHRPVPPAHCELTAKLSLTAGIHTFVLETIVGGKGLRADLGEVCVAIAAEDDEQLQVLADDIDARFPLTEEAWEYWLRADRAHLHDVDMQHRRQAASADDEYWQSRHDLAKAHLDSLAPLPIPAVKNPQHVNNAIDNFIVSELESRSLSPASVVDDTPFLRRVTLDTVGVIPSLAEIDQFQRDPAPDRRSRLIDRLIEDPRWADHWVSYWQDVLAENPNILKASLNNTGPFRWWIYESFLDNKPIDRFATDLILMRGSRYSGGPAGFAMATQNDVPEANKALILSKAFLAANLNCARCHDSPINDFSQKQLFSVAAMLRRKALALPATSTVAFDKAARPPAVEVSLTPGDLILPHWPLDEIASDELPSGVLRDASDPREWLAAIITSPRNRRFAEVIVNRLWCRLTGRGLVTPIDDWHDAEATHPELLEYLARELVANQYDFKHVARLIFNSQTYQRAIHSEAGNVSGEELFATAQRRRMTAEQIFDSLFAVVGKDVHAERLTMDPEGRRPISTFLNLGVPRRAWQFSSLSNERDRPALSLPIAQSANDLLKSFGWRESRQDPATMRDNTVTPLQPLALANGTIGRRLVGLSDDHAITHLAIYDLSLAELTDTVFRLFLTREPSDEEQQAIIEILAEGFEERIQLDAVPIKDAFAWQRHPVSWSNHLYAKSSEIMLRLEQRAREGDPPTPRLKQDWRERMEDVLWALANNPEFVFVP